ncbi:peptidylarginine deiminase-like enzyme [Caulobacter sp. AP07]|uniref:agmatine deiminase family protein n=1 Tax=Caulobacter sp. AP07 TaxID=1144304 RepID=UPI000271E8A1|nr:agmatine deiminase family protein [Caulobacter sp. AP07]EJL32948.1 peptidylarginine deiminase-like enzyme [Caulobacter sp. AP07]
MISTVPAEWAPHRAMWVGFPSHAELWREDLDQAQAEVAALARALAGPGGERVRLMVVGDEAEAAALALLGDTDVEIVRGQFGDIWLRDTGPIFIETADGAVAAGFQFNGWGGKYQMEGDDIVAEQIAAASGAPLARNGFVLEGGALDHDGSGTILTTRQCLLNPNRNGDFDEAKATAALAAALGARKVLWLGDGLLNDHTDGHVDNLARFVAPGVVACPMAFGADDPNAEVYAETARTLAAMTDSRGSPLQVMRIPSPGRILDEDGEIIPASHMNFLIANEAVIVPIYAEESGAFAVEVISGLFPEREVIGLPSTAILTGGGSFHCISQQEPGE